MVLNEKIYRKKRKNKRKKIKMEQEMNMNYEEKVRIMENNEKLKYRVVQSRSDRRKKGTEVILFGVGLSRNDNVLRNMGFFEVNHNLIGVSQNRNDGIFGNSELVFMINGDGIGL